MEAFRAIFIVLLVVGFMMKIIALINGQDYESDPCPSGFNYCDGE